ncbi:hypothetical protein PQC07_gp058 [Aeromonas phage D3]|uniref:Uncharacterized protein n=2 Tax=Ludhianavirus TaxID=3044751 RepID=A0A514TV88_9CAUD|nr:hypothetical protein PQC07_gp058 [Aeromonas phage D3]YP_010668965.1 hypothetical protein PQC08_gp058 [Aeromonas phage D6]QDJ96947.1 hypothetical protein D3_0217 [Aeromonas phage D3]QDJ97376.1 hypothetical protein D6_0217 [Aeromonas phage D6]QEP52253.1 hypothetical protein D9_0046 [Aeromonas phage D9]
MWFVIREVTDRFVLNRVVNWASDKTQKHLVGSLSGAVVFCVFLLMILANVSVKAMTLWYERRALLDNLTHVEARMLDVQENTNLFIGVLHETNESKQALIADNIKLKNDLSLLMLRNKELVKRNRLLEKELDLSQK